MFLAGKEELYHSFFSNLYHYLPLYLRLLQEILFPTSAHQVSTSRSVWFSCWEAWPSSTTWEKLSTGELRVLFPLLYESQAQSIPTLEMQGLGAPWRLHSSGLWGMVLGEKRLEGGVCTRNGGEARMAVNKYRAGWDHPTGLRWDDSGLKRTVTKCKDTQASQLLLLSLCPSQPPRTLKS